MDNKNKQEIPEAPLEEAAQEPVEEPNKPIENAPAKDAPVEEAPTAEQSASDESELRKILGLKEEDDLKGHIKSLKDYKEQNETVNAKLLDLFEAQPEIGSFLKDVLRGAPANIAIARNFDISELEPQEGEPDYEEWGKAVESRKKTLAEKQKYLKEIEDNVNMSAKELDAFTKENNLSDEEAEEFVKSVDQLVADLVKGKVTKDALTRFYKGINYDKDLEEKSKVAEVKGKNAKIEDLQKKEAAKVGDGIPKLKAQNKVKESAPAPEPDNWSRAIDAHLKRRKI